MILLMVWIVCGIFNLIFYLCQCVKDGEILVQDIFLSLIMLFIGLIGTVLIFCFLITDSDTDKVVWKKKDKILKDNK